MEFLSFPRHMKARTLPSGAAVLFVGHCLLLGSGSWIPGTDDMKLSVERTEQRLCYEKMKKLD